MARLPLTPPGPRKEVNGEPFTFAVIPRSVGTVTLNNVTVNVNVSQFFTVHSASVPGGSCSIAPMQVNCTLPTLAAGAEPRIEISATSPFANSFDVTANIAAANDRYLTNNTAQGSVVLLAAADAAIAISANTTAVTSGEPIDFTIRVTSLRVRQVKDVSFDVSSSGSLYFLYDAFTPATGCTVGIVNALCAVGDLNPGESRQFVLRAIPRQGGTGRMLANVNASNDFDSRNNRAETGDLTVTARRDAGLELDPTFRLAPVGVPTELTFLVKAGGLEPINNVVVALYPGSDNEAVNP